MPNTGRPSRGCQACKDRKVKVGASPNTRAQVVLSAETDVAFSIFNSVMKLSRPVSVVKEMGDNAQAIHS